MKGGIEWECGHYPTIIVVIISLFYRLLLTVSVMKINRAADQERISEV